MMPQSELPSGDRTPPNELPYLYCRCLEDVNRRLTFIKALTNGSVTTNHADFDYELAALGLRKTLETIAFASLCANKEAYEQAHADFATHWSASRLLKKLRLINPHFYPRPVQRHVKSEGPPRVIQFEFIDDGYLSEDQFTELYDVCSNVVHTRNPFVPNTPIEFKRSVSDWIKRIETLLGTHKMRPAGTTTIWIAELRSPNDGRAHVYQATPT